MNFRKRISLIIASVSLALAACASALSYYIEQERQEDTILDIAAEESQKVLAQSNLFALDEPARSEQAENAAKIIAGGFFDIVEIYDSQGKKLAEHQSETGEQLEAALPPHQKPGAAETRYENIDAAGRWAMRIFVPVSQNGSLLGYMEGVRLVPRWQEKNISMASLQASLLTALASLLCGAILYPILMSLYSGREKKAREVLDSHLSMMEALGRAIAKRDSDTGSHNYRVAYIASKTAEAMGFGRERMQNLIAGSFLHDVGKIGIPDAILLKPGKLDEAEFETMKTHVELGSQIVHNIGWLEGARNVVACHHEKFNGQGYPQGLAGEQIPLEARIFAVVDVFDALASKRPYKDPLPIEKTVQILESERGKHFDPAVLDAFLPIAAQMHAQFANAGEDLAKTLLHGQIERHFGQD